jgi:response regulator RpfG family c-di-GMP phosphodiesterase
MKLPFSRFKHGEAWKMGERADACPRTVTVVDDEPWALDVLVRAARSWRYECQSASSAEQALELLEKNITPVVVTDLRMPGRGGVWLVKEIQRRWPEVAIIVITAGQDPEAVTECLNAGAHHYFLKPIKLDEFRHALASTVRACRIQREQSANRRRLEKQVEKRTRQVRQTFLSAIDSLVRTLEARDPCTSGHSTRVRQLALRLAERLGLTLKQRKQISLAAKLHDIGKLGLPESILNKPGQLTPEEFNLVREHPAIGQRILSPILRGKSVLAAIRGHHERFDGAGYPDGLSGEGIPLHARILSIADCYDAMTSSRAYRQALPQDAALALIRAGTNKQFDDRLVQVFLGLFE